jgi:aromatic-amino-acid transaminase
MVDAGIAASPCVNPSATTGSPLIPEARARPADDPIFALDAEAQRLAQTGKRVINATLGALMEDDGTLAVMPSVAEALAGVPLARAASYAPIAGDAAFREAVVGDLLGGTPLAGQAVAVATPGGTGALHHAVTNFLGPGEALLTTSYYWGPYRTIADHTRRGLVAFPMFGSDGSLDLGAFESALMDLLRRQERVLVIFNSPCHNPTGYSLEQREWAESVRILRAAARRGAVTFLNDFAYAKYGEQAERQWLERAAEMVGEVVLLVAWTVSKSFALYGARVGALVAVHPDPEERQRIFNALSYSCRGTWSNCNHLGLLAIERLLSDPDLRARSDRERARLVRMLAERVQAFNLHAGRAGLAYPRYRGGFFVSVFTPRPEVTAAVARERGVFVVPIQGAVRVALCSTSAAQVPELVGALADGLAAARA